MTAPKKKPFDPDEPVKPSDLEQIAIPDHDGLPITQTLAKITRTGDGLSESMSLTPIHIPVETKVMVLVPAIAKGHGYKRVTEGKGEDKHVIDEFAETVTLEATGALLLDPDLVKTIVTEHMDRIGAARAEAERLKKEAKGEFSLPFAEGDEDGAGE
jgi:uncharacterized small protein (DUF1192 family)